MSVFAPLPQSMRASLAVLVSVIFLAGCQKKAAPVSQASGSESPAAAQPATPLPLPSKPVIANAENNVQENVAGQADPFLTSQLKIFIQEKGRLPASFAEFAKARLDSIPRPPAGTKWVIDAPSQQIKAMPVK